MVNYSEEIASAPYMQRTKYQLETAYSPGALFTFEGFLTVCESVPAKQYPSMQHIPSYAKKQIFDNISERISAWYRSAMQKADQPLPFMCVDWDLLNSDKSDLNDQLNRSQFDFVEPKIMGYFPTLLTFVCNHCKRVQSFKDLGDFDRNKTALTKHTCSESGKSCHWRQLDIVFVHPNGNYLKPEPWRYNYNENKDEIYEENKYCKHCGSDKVCLNERSPQLSNRFYFCADCGVPRDSQWIQNDREWLRKFRGIGDRMAADIRMKAISYRANSVHYPQQDMVIDFGQNERLEILSDISSKKLIDAVVDIFSFPTTLIPESIVKEQVLEQLGEVAWREYEQKVEFVKGTALPEPVTRSLKEAIRETEREWQKMGITSSRVELPIELFKNLENRRELFSHRYDPFRLLIEHRALLDQIVSNQIMENGQPYYASMDKLDQYIGPDKPAKRDALNKEHRRIMDRSGIETIGLVRKFETLQYSFGFTRVDSKPVTKYINARKLPVRLKLFDKTSIDEQQKHPIFTLKQNNEAIYVRLNKKVVAEWLRRLNTEVEIDEELLGAQYLETAPPMGDFLDNLPHESLEGPSMSLAVYSMLHTYAHHVMYAISDFSGLGVGSLGEYLFPADLAFVVYRRGMTMDLGNLTSMLRNNAPAFLKYLEDRTNLGCGSGTLCISRGGACPDCLLIPEVSCITQNKLLSRTLLVGKGHPANYGFNANIEGFLDVAQQMIHI